MKKTTLVLILLLLAGLVFGKRVAVLEEVGRPELISVDNQNVYITEGTTVYVYSTDDFKLKKSFGRQGEGPQEFIPQISVTPLKDSLLINSSGKISYFSRDGRFIKELRAGTGFARVFTPMGNHFVGLGFLRDNGKFLIAINIYDGELKKVREITRFENFLRQGGKINPLGLREMVYQVMDGLIFFNAFGEGQIEVFDISGKKLRTIRHGFDTIKLTDEHRQKIEASYLADHRYKRQYHAVKHMIQYPENFPAIHQYYADQNKVYVLTYKRKENRAEFYIFTVEGKLVKRVMVPFYQTNPHLPYPFTVKNNRIYQVVENLENDEWELHISPLE